MKSATSATWRNASTRLRNPLRYLRKARNVDLVREVFALHERILADEKLKDIPFVFLTGSTDSRVARYVREKNIRLISKSNLINELLSLISSLP